MFSISFFFFNLFYLFIFGCVRSSLLHAGFLQLAASRGLLFVAVRGLLIPVASLVAGARALGTRTQKLWLAGSRAQAQQLWCTGFVAPRHVGSFWSRARTRVPCIGRRILNHCATREALACLLSAIWVCLIFYHWNVNFLRTGIFVVIESVYKNIIVNAYCQEILLLILISQSLISRLSITN